MGVFWPIVSTDLTAALFAPGMIVPFYGTAGSVPAGWALCDGTNGTPNLDGIFLMGAGAVNAAGTTGGATTHNHTFSGGGLATLNAGNVILSSSPSGNYLPNAPISISGVTNTKNHLPPYRAILYIMKL